MNKIDNSENDQSENEQTCDSEKIQFNISDSFKLFYGGLHFSNLFKVLIRDDTIVMDSCFTNSKVRYHSKNGFTASQILYLFARQYEHEMVLFDELEKSDGVVIDEEELEGKWRSFESPEEKEDYLNGRTLDFFEYDPVTKIVTCHDSS